MTCGSAWSEQRLGVPRPPTLGAEGRSLAGRGMMPPKPTTTSKVSMVGISARSPSSTETLALSLAFHGLRPCQARRPGRRRPAREEAGPGRLPASGLGAYYGGDVSSVDSRKDRSTRLAEESAMLVSRIRAIPVAVARRCRRTGRRRCAVRDGSPLWTGTAGRELWRPSLERVASAAPRTPRRVFPAPARPA